VISLAQVYHWQGRIREYFPKLGYWQTLNMALYSLGMVVARHSAPSRVAEKLGVMGKADTVQRRLERFLDNHEVCWWECCRYWARWVLRRYQGERVILLVDETKLGQHLSVMVVGLAYRGCCIPLVWWCYPPKAWPDGQVAVIDELLWWVAQSLPEGTSPLVEADRGIGTSPALVRCVEPLRLAVLVSGASHHTPQTARYRTQSQAVGECARSTMECYAGSGLQKSGLAHLQCAYHLGSRLSRLLVPDYQC